MGNGVPGVTDLINIGTTAFEIPLSVGDMMSSGVDIAFLLTYYF
jgi:hypothetical protein